jgi:hypothetical protein
VSRTLLRPSPRLRKQNPPRLRRLRSGRYPYQSRRELTLPAQAHLWGPLVRRVRLGQGDPEAPVVRVRRWARPGLGRQHLPAGPAVRLIRAARVDQLPRARRLALWTDRSLRPLCALRTAGTDWTGRASFTKQDQEDLAVPAQACRPPTQLLPWQQQRSSLVASALPGVKQKYCTCMSHAVNRKSVRLQR